MVQRVHLFITITSKLQSLNMGTQGNIQPLTGSEFYFAFCYMIPLIYAFYENCLLLWRFRGEESDKKTIPVEVKDPGKQNQAEFTTEDDQNLCSVPIPALSKQQCSKVSDFYALGFG
mgnify:FL=1